MLPMAIGRFPEIIRNRSFRSVRSPHADLRSTRVLLPPRRDGAHRADAGRRAHRGRHVDREPRAAPDGDRSRPRLLGPAVRQRALLAGRRRGRDRSRRRRRSGGRAPCVPRRPRRVPRRQRARRRGTHRRRAARRAGRAGRRGRRRDDRCAGHHQRQLVGARARRRVRALRRDVRRRLRSRPAARRGRRRGRRLALRVLDQPRPRPDRVRRRPPPRARRRPARRGAPCRTSPGRSSSPPP